MSQSPDLDINVFNFLNSRTIYFVDIFMYAKQKERNKVSIVSGQSANGKDGRDYFENCESENLKKSIDDFFFDFCRHVLKNYGKYNKSGNLIIEYKGVSFYMSMGSRSQSPDMFDLKLVEVELTSACKAKHEKEIILSNFPELIISKEKDVKKRI